MPKLTHNQSMLRAAQVDPYLWSIEIGMAVARMHYWRVAVLSGRSPLWS